MSIRQKLAKKVCGSVLVCFRQTDSLTHLHIHRDDKKCVQVRFYGVRVLLSSLSRLSLQFECAEKEYGKRTQGFEAEIKDIKERQKRICGYVKNFFK